MHGATKRQTSVLPHTGRLPDLDHGHHWLPDLASRASSIAIVACATGVIAANGLAFVVRLDVTVAATGTIEPAQAIPVRAAAPGFVHKVLVEPGDEVTAGQTLAVLDPREVLLSIEQLDAQIRAKTLELDHLAETSTLDDALRAEQRVKAQARLTSTLAVLRQQIVDHGIVGDADSLLRSYVPGGHVGLDLAVSAVLVAESDVRVALQGVSHERLDRLKWKRLAAELDQLAAARAALGDKLEELTIVSPIHGMIITEAIDVLAGALLRPGDLVLEVVSLNDWVVRANVSEHDVDRVRRGDRISVAIPALGSHIERPMAGRVIRVATEPEGRLNPQARTATQQFRVIGALDPADARRAASDGSLRTGYSAHVRIVTRSELVAVLVWRYFLRASGGRR